MNNLLHAYDPQRGDWLVMEQSTDFIDIPTMIVLAHCPSRASAIRFMHDLETAEREVRSRLP